MCRAEEFGPPIAWTTAAFRGYGGKTKHWNYTADVLTLTSALLATTRSMKIFASIGVLSLHPAMVARMAATIDDFALPAGNQHHDWLAPGLRTPEMGMWPDGYFEHRYDYATEYAAILQELWTTGVCDFKGKHFELDDCRLGPTPAHHIDICAAGMSPRGRRFSAKFADFNFTRALGPDNIRAVNRELEAAAAEHGLRVKVLTPRTVILDDTDELAYAKVAHYNDGADKEALANQKEHYELDSSGTSSALIASEIKTCQAMDPGNLSTSIGSPRTVARNDDRRRRRPGGGPLDLEYNFRRGVDRFGAIRENSSRRRTSTTRRARRGDAPGFVPRARQDSAGPGRRDGLRP